MDFEDIVPFIFTAIILLLVGCLIGLIVSDPYEEIIKIKKDAIDNNAAEYVVDKYGNIEFKWKTCK